MRIIVDVMGGDNAPREMVLGVLDAAAEYDESVEYTLVGDEAAIRAIAEDVEADLSNFTIVPTEQVITMEDDPVCVMRAKKDSSMSTALRMLADGQGDAVVSTGNTGALFTGAMLIVRKIKHIQRAGIATILPLQNPVLLMDTGANVEVTEENLEQFARLGSAYMKTLYGLESPRVGLLNNGTEDCKGTALQVSAHARLAAMQDINFVGNVEGSALPFDVCDVLVTDGFTGNILVKTIEGMGKLLMSEIKNIFYGTGWKGKVAGALVKKPMYAMKKRFDANEIGGAPILGVSKPVIKAHGSSNAKAFKNAIGQAIAYASSTTIDDITATMAAVAEQKKAEQRRAAKEEEEELTPSPYPRLK
ncbi:MAG: phosphate acyltransferase PlsX [Ruminococcaceae bacterium]|nr:phosphate acyltransferase PlsX [Oscillospiraceae bacterium]